MNLSKGIESAQRAAFTAALVFFLYSVCLAAGNPAPTPSSAPNSSFLIRPWAVGQSATYQTKTFQNGQLLNIETTTYSIVGEEKISGHNYFWFETERSDSSGVTSILKVQVRQPGAIDFENALDKEFYADGSGPMAARRRIHKIIPSKGFSYRFSVVEMELPAESVNQVENSEPFTSTENVSGRYDAVPNKSTQVPAGTFKTMEFQGNFPIATPAPGAGEVVQTLEGWGAPGVPIWGLVKNTTQTVGDQGKVTRETELVSYNESGAVSKVVEKIRLVSLKEQNQIKENLSQQSPGLFSTPNKEQP